MIPRRKLSELLVRYRLEPTLDDVYVEGERDKRIFDRAHERFALHRPIYSITSIEIESSVLLDFSLTEGNRQRVIALCRKLNLPRHSHVKFIIDLDMDHYRDRRMDIPNLLYTTYTDIEGIFFYSEMVSDLITGAGNVKVADWDKLFKSIEDVVIQVYCVRLSLDEMNICIRVPSISKSLVKSKNEVKFESKKFISKLSGQGLDSITLSNIEDRYNFWYEKLKTVPARSAGRGYDYLEVVCWVIKKFGGSVPVANALEDILMLLTPTVSKEILDQLPPKVAMTHA